MSMIDTENSPRSILALRAPDRMAYKDYPRLHPLPRFKLSARIGRLKALFTLPEIMPAHPEAPEKIEPKARPPITARIWL